ncbi:hypothetical protein ACLI4Y_16665 [Natrialbaceae archaeon A-CW3]
MKAVHDWVHKADLTPKDGASSEHVAHDETVIWIDGRQYWRYEAAAPETNRLLNIRLNFARNSDLSKIYTRNLWRKRIVDAVSLIDSAAWRKVSLHYCGLQLRFERYGDRNSVDYVYKSAKR